MDSPTKHHFNPAFSLRPWALKGGQICEMRRVNGTISPRRTYPTATAFRPNLYRTEGVAPELEQHLEVKFMKPLDTAAARALQKITLGDTSPWGSKPRSAWTLYIMSLMFRNPETVQPIKGHVTELWDAGVKALEGNYASRRLPTDPATFEEYFARTNPAAPQIGATNLLAEIINNKQVAPAIFKMHWSRIILRKANITLLNSDRPLERPFGLGNPRGYIAFPIGPRMIFLAANDPTLAARIGGGNHSKVAKMMNKTVVSQARQFVWGIDDSQLEYVRRYMGSAPERVVITEQQRAEAIAAVQGNANRAKKLELHDPAPPLAGGQE
jgi:uncharacterized protein DUF4238